MSTIYDDASLILYPSGYKAGKLYSLKPTNGTGDLDVVRATTATRVNSAGLIEKVRTNLLLRSEEFDNASWNKTTDGQVTITANAAAAPDGTTTAEKMIPSALAGFHCVAQTITLSAGEVTISVFAKAAENSFLQIFDSLTTDFANFNLTTGAVGSTDAYVASIQSAGNGWFRCTATKVVPSGSFVLRYGVVTTATAVRGESFTGNGTDGLLIWGAQAETGVATPYIPTTTTAVSVGMTANIPRIDYTGGGCGKLLLEPQRTNSARNAQITAATWDKSSLTVTASSGIAPTGFNEAYRVAPTTSGADRFFYDDGGSTSYTASADYTNTIFAKANGLNFCYARFEIKGNTSSFVYFNLATGVVGSTVGPVPIVKSIENYGNGWYRIRVTGNMGTGIGGANNVLFGVCDADGSTNVTASGTNSVLFFGPQSEQGSYATSYIPTLGAAVTRGADAASKTGISSLIGQTEGTLFVDFNWQQKDGVFFLNSISDGTTNNEIMMAFGSTADNRLRFSIASGGTVSVSFDSATLASGTYKVAFAYANNDAVAYINGVQQFTDSSVVVPATSQFKFARATDVLNFEGTINQQLLFPTRLTNTQLQELTTL